MPREHEIAGSNPAVLTFVMRWGPCWYGQAAVNRNDAGSIPATAAQTFVIVCGFDSLPCYLNNMRRLGIGEPKWL